MKFNYFLESFLKFVNSEKNRIIRTIFDQTNAEKNIFFEGCFSVKIFRVACQNPTKNAQNFKSNTCLYFKNSIKKTIFSLLVSNLYGYTQTLGIINVNDDSSNESYVKIMN